MNPEIRFERQALKEWIEDHSNEELIVLREVLINALQRYDPNVDETEFHEAFKTRQEFVETEIDNRGGLPRQWVNCVPAGLNVDSSAPDTWKLKHYVACSFIQQDDVTSVTNDHLDLSGLPSLAFHHVNVNESTALAGSIPHPPPLPPSNLTISPLHQCERLSPTQNIHDSEEDHCRCLRSAGYITDERLLYRGKKQFLVNLQVNPVTNEKPKLVWLDADRISSGVMRDWQSRRWGDMVEQVLNERRRRRRNRL